MKGLSVAEGAQPWRKKKEHRVAHASRVRCFVRIEAACAGVEATWRSEGLTHAPYTQGGAVRVFCLGPATKEGDQEGAARKPKRCVPHPPYRLCPPQSQWWLTITGIYAVKQPSATLTPGLTPYPPC